MYVKSEMDMGDEIKVRKVMAPMYGNHNRRSKRIKPSREAVKKINFQHRVDLCSAKLKMNFKPHDWHIALTFDPNQYPDVTEEFAKKARADFVVKLRKLCRHDGIELKYLYMSEVGVKSGRWHHHFVLPAPTRHDPKAGVTTDMLYECWKYGHIRILNTLYQNGDFHGLAVYFCDKTKGGQSEDTRAGGRHSYQFSRNCVSPVITYEIISSANWSKKPRAKKGYRIKPGSIYSGETPSGYPYQTYILQKVSVQKNN